MRNKFLISAAVLVASTGFAVAQGTGSGASAPAPSTSPPQSQSSPAPAEKSATPSAGKEAPGSTTQKGTQADKMAPISGAGPAAKSGATDTKNPPSSANGQKNTASPNAAGDGRGAAPPPEKQTQIASAIKSEKVQEVTNVNFNISVGTVVPGNVHFYPLPPRIVEIYPEWRGYEFILVKGRYVIVRPRTHEIVYIIEG